MQTTARNLSHLSRDRGYRFRDRDPALEQVCQLATDSGMSTAEIAQRVATLSRGAATVRRQTIDAWLNGTVRRPQNYTLSWVAFALGYERKWTKVRRPPQ